MTAVPPSPEQRHQHARDLERQARDEHRRADLDAETGRLRLACDRLAQAVTAARATVPGIAAEAEAAVAADRHAEDQSRRAAALAAEAAAADEAAATDGTSPEAQEELMARRDRYAKIAQREAAKHAAATGARQAAEKALTAAHGKVRRLETQLADAKNALTDPRPSMSRETLASCWQEILLRDRNPVLAARYADITDKDVKSARELAAVTAELAGADKIFADVERLRIEAERSRDRIPSL
jgi:hypothetical protein